MIRRLSVLVLAAASLDAFAGDAVVVRTADEFRAAVARAKPGARIEVAPGEYAGTFHFSDLRGDERRPVVIAAKDAAKPPVFKVSGLQLSDPAHVEIRDLVFEGQTGNAVNIDDGGTLDTPAHHVLLAGLTIRDTNAAGNVDGIKLSGVTDFRVLDCTIERWGRGGSGIDMVGCARGVIERCSFRHDEDASGANGVQMKGATRDVAVRRSKFMNAGGRAVNAGGSTGLQYFRPPLEKWKGEKYEAKDLTIEGCTITGSDAAVAFVGVAGAVFRFNTVYMPKRWFCRILQENRAEGFVPSQRGAIADNVIVFDSRAWREGGVNRGDATLPATFTFERNVWFCADAPERTRSLLALPSEEKDGVFGKDPKFKDAANGDFSAPAGSPASKAGAAALRD